MLFPFFSILPIFFPEILPVRSHIATFSSQGSPALLTMHTKFSQAVRILSPRPSQTLLILHFNSSQTNFGWEQLGKAVWEAVWGPLGKPRGPTWEQPGKEPGRAWEEFPGVWEGAGKGLGKAWEQDGTTWE